MQKPYSAPEKLADQRSRRKTIISLTPLIDVVFILLVFFMLASSFLDWRTVSLDTRAASTLAAPAQATPFVVEIRGDSLALNGTPITLEALLRQAQARRPADQPVSLQPLGTTPVQPVIRVLDALHGAGVRPLELIEDPQWQPEPVGEGRDALP